jgi:RHH-type proline utilization regulon transcriptional repressor/proline dehydrogenase/delta 1-pyrroline-5-carboxylate dehydrogenase
VSFPPDVRTSWHRDLEILTGDWGAAIEFVEEGDAELAELIAAGQTDRVRYAAMDRAPAVILSAVGETGVYIARSPVLAHARVELLWYLREQSICEDYHRYGNLGVRAKETRRAVL